MPVSNDYQWVRAEMSGDVVTALAGLGGALVGGPLWNFLIARLNLGAAREEKDSDRLRRELAEEKASHRGCLDRLDELERRVEVVEHHHSSYLARWIVQDSSRRIVWLNNQALIMIFAPLGYSRVDVVGRRFVDLLEADAAAEIERLDRAALAQPGRAASTLMQVHHTLPKMIVVKVAGIGRDSELIYEGYAYNPNDPAEIEARGEQRRQEQYGASKLFLAGPDVGGAGGPVI
ncbi:hypothetical protein [Sphingosinicella sp. BN140058]|uniref:hypothetical protein n=1 Tax=Sphingosinicella sp. BN140058 TaxID=1892855 RepID=UPI0010137CF8|nr:hypothetical protein [Sphingosinicella sp. BN140058]QAY77934.1 hypothetical protein ETR14_16440 [Sphingosinicella sp. BN140058]